MNRRLGPTLFAILACCLSCANVAPAAEDVLSIVPDGALAVAVVSRVGETQGKIAALAKQLDIPGAEAFSAGPFSLESQPHIDKAGDVAMALLPLSDEGQPVFLWFVPTTNYESLLDQFGAEKGKGKISKVTIAGADLVVAQKKGYAILTTRDQRKHLRAALSAKANVAAATTKLRDWRTAQDAYAIALPAGIKLAQQQILAGLTIVKAQVAQAGEQAETTLAGLEMYEALFQAMDKEITHFAAGVQLQEDGSVQLVSRSLLAEGGVLAKLAQQVEPFQGNVLAGLPQGEFFIAGGGTLPKAWGDELLKFSFEMLKMYPGGEDMTEDDLQKLAGISAESMKGMRSMAMLIGIGAPDQPLYSNFLIVFQVDDAEQYLKTYEKSMREMIEFGKRTDYNPLLNSYTMKNMEIDGKPGLNLTMDMSPYLGENQPPEAQQALKAMFGDPSKFEVFLVPADSTTVVGSYISQQQIPRVVKAVNGSAPQLADDAHVQATVALLPDDAQWVGLWSPRGTLQFVRQMMASILPDEAPPLPDFPATSPLGFAGKLTPDGAETVLAVPADVIKASVEMAKSLAPREE